MDHRTETCGIKFHALVQWSRRPLRHRRDVCTTINWLLFTQDDTILDGANHDARVDRKEGDNSRRFEI